MQVKLEIYYTDGEVVEKSFEQLEDCLDYIRAEVVEKHEFADEIKIKVD